MMEPEEGTGVSQPMRRLNPTVIALIAGGALILLFLVWMFAGNRNPAQDKLGDNQLVQARPADPEKRCASQATYDLIKRELFRRAAQVRGSDQAAFDKLSAYAVVRMERPVLVSQNKDVGSVNCTGSLSLDLPPGVAVVGGRRTLTADIDYALQPAADASGDVLTLTNADAIITPLATLARVSQSSVSPTSAPPSSMSNGASAPNPVDPGVPPPPPVPGPSSVPSFRPAPATPTSTAPVHAAPAPSASARPSFNCANARTFGEIAVCNDPGLASLDRQMAAQFNRAISNADPGERALLDRTRLRFLAYRDGCRSNDCIAEAYRGRMREIRDIVAGQWTPQ